MTALPAKAMYGVAARLHILRDRVVDNICTWTHGSEWLIERMFDPAVLEACRQGYQYCCPSNRTGSHAFRILYTPSVDMNIYFDNMLTPHADYVQTAPVELIEYCSEVHEILVKYAKVEFVLNWLQAHADNGASLREYATWAPALFADRWQKNLAGTRTYEPDGLGAMLPLIREAATTMAAGFLAQSKSLETPLGFSLTFYTNSVTDQGCEIPIPYYVRQMKC